MWPIRRLNLFMSGPARICTSRNWDIFINTKTEPLAGRRRGHDRGHYVQGRGGGEQGELRPAISAPRGGPHLDLGRLRLKTWSKMDSSIAGTTWRTFREFRKKEMKTKQKKCSACSAHGGCCQQLEIC